MLAISVVVDIQLNYWTAINTGSLARGINCVVNLLEFDSGFTVFQVNTNQIFANSGQQHD